MVSALQFFEAHLEYSEGAVARLPMSLDIAPFRMALGRAPKAPSRADSDWGQDRPDLVFIRLSESPKEDGYYEWDVTCLERIFKGTLNSIHALQKGTNGDAWKTLRWEAYDKVRFLTCSLPCNRSHTHSTPINSDAGSGMIPRRSRGRTLRQNGCRRR